MIASANSGARVPLRRYQPLPQIASSSGQALSASSSAAVLISTASQPRPSVWVRVLPSAGVQADAVPRLTAVLPQAPIAAEGWRFIKRTTSTLAEQVGAVSEVTFRCPFCFENVRERERVVFSACGNKEHGVCSDCMGHYIRGLVNDGRVSSVDCHKCRRHALPAEVLSLTDDATFRKYERFKQMQQDHTVRECPSCNKMNKPDVDEDSEPIAEMRCEDCNTEFCFYHSNAHVGVPCAEYRKHIAREERLVEQGPLRDTKACPVCGVRTEKTGGCNHMTCQRCGSDWCWVCGEKLDEVTAHYYLGGPFACGQFADDAEPRTALTQLFRCIVVPLQMLSVLLFVVLSLTMIFWFPVVYILLAPCYLSWRTCKMSAGAIKCVVLVSILLSYLPFVCFQICWTIFAGFLWFVLKPCGAERRHIFHLLRAPILAILPVLLCVQLLMDHVRGTEEELAAAEAAAAGQQEAAAPDLEAASALEQGSSGSDGSGSDSTSEE